MPARSSYLAQDHFRIAWLGLYLASTSPCRSSTARALDMAALAHRADLGLLLRADGTRPDDAPEGKYLYVAAGSSRARTARRALPRPEVRRVRARHRRHVPGPREADLAPPPPRLRAVVRGDPEARPRRHVPAALARPERRRPLLRERDLPQPRHRRRPRLPRRAHRRRGLSSASSCPGFEETWRYG